MYKFDEFRAINVYHSVISQVFYDASIGNSANILAFKYDAQNLNGKSERDAG